MIGAYLAKQYAKFYPSDTFIAVAGSVGKTSTVAAALAILKLRYKTLTSKPNLDPSSNIPSTLLKLNPSVKKVILEMGVRRKGEMDFYLSLVKPQIVILTNISHAHSEYLGNINEISRENGKLIEGLGKSGVAILNWDDQNSKKLADLGLGTVVYYGLDPTNSLVWAGNIKIENFRTTFELNLGVERVKINYQLLGLNQVYSALAASALGVVCSIPLTKIKLALESIEPQEHQLQAVSGPNGSVILDDSVNCSPTDLDSAIDVLLQVPARRRILVLGEMKELGEYSEEMQRAVAQRIYKEKLDFVFLGQGDTEIVADELQRLGFWEERVEGNLQNSKLVGKLLKLLGKGDVCLIKGSREVRLDEVVGRITKK